MAIAVRPLAALPDQAEDEPLAEEKPDEFDPRCDAIPVANLLAANYNWMNNSTDAIPFRIATLLRDRAEQDGKGMRVLRRCDNLTPVGFSLFYPTQRSSEALFFGPSSKGLHLSALTDVDPFEYAQPGDSSYRTVFFRSWAIAAP
ncbi:hypothetical protein [Rubidibacter lacunae]|uniref:hypothetical protein n=1 Tax=Rubidibacter lacunae TaxID=582514 RepID=UPI000412ACA8|nr:hypothetical protein [Rubidibacter lacunae]